MRPTSKAWKPLKHPENCMKRSEIPWKSFGASAFSAHRSHFKQEAALDARYLKDRFFRQLKHPVFLDSDDLHNLTDLKAAVKASDVVVFLQTTRIFTRPWCIIEAYCALTCGQPVVAVRVLGAFRYEFEQASQVLNYLDEELDASQQALVEKECAAPLTTVAYVLATKIPHVRGPHEICSLFQIRERSRCRGHNQFCGNFCIPESFNYIDLGSALAGDLEDVHPVRRSARAGWRGDGDPARLPDRGEGRAGARTLHADPQRGAHFTQLPRFQKKNMEKS